MLKKIISWGLAIFIAFVFVSSLFFKFTAAAEPVHIFTTIENWFVNDLGLGFLSFFEPGGRIGVGIAELLAAVLVLIPATRVKGAFLSLLIMIGALFFHLVSPLGWTVRWMENGQQQTDPTLAWMAVGVFISSIVLIFFHGYCRSCCKK